jgi:hypothetical protein
VLLLRRNMLEIVHAFADRELSRNATVSVSRLRKA